MRHNGIGQAGDDMPEHDPMHRQDEPSMAGHADGGCLLPGRLGTVHSTFRTEHRIQSGGFLAYLRYTIRT